jgi:hypothetical protein
MKAGRVVYSPAPLVFEQEWAWRRFGRRGEEKNVCFLPEVESTHSKPI